MVPWVASANMHPSHFSGRKFQNSISATVITHLVPQESFEPPLLAAAANNASSKKPLKAFTAYC